MRSWPRHNALQGSWVQRCRESRGSVRGTGLDRDRRQCGTLRQCRCRHAAHDAGMQCTTWVQHAPRNHVRYRGIACPKVPRDGAGNTADLTVPRASPCVPGRPRRGTPEGTCTIRTHSGSPRRGTPEGAGLGWRPLAGGVRLAIGQGWHGGACACRNIVVPWEERSWLCHGMCGRATGRWAHAPSCLGVVQEEEAVGRLTVHSGYTQGTLRVQYY